MESAQTTRPLKVVLVKVFNDQPQNLPCLLVVVA